MNKIITAIWLLGLLVGINAPAHAAFSPVSVSLIRPLQFPPSDFNITGTRLSLLWGEQRDVYGLDVGLLGNITNGRFAGLAVSGLFNRTLGDTSILGLQFAGLLNYNSNKTSVTGLQLAAVNLNTAASSIRGLQLGLANVSQHTVVYGIQAGIYNRALSVWGIQVGIVNVCDNLHGLQIGLLNFHTKGVFAVSPIINFGF